MSINDNFGPRVYLGREDIRLFRQAVETGWQTIRIGYPGRTLERQARRQIYLGALERWIDGEREVKNLARAGVCKALNVLPPGA